MTESLQNMMGGDTSVTEQFFATLRRSEHLEPEKNLLIAILQDAIHDYRKYCRARDPEGKEHFREAHNWIMADGDNWIFSFNNICEFLGLGPDYIRRGLHEPDADRTKQRENRKSRDLH
jgi:hypothetical protein